MFLSKTPHSHSASLSLFQALSQWGGSKKRARDERDVIRKKKLGESAFSSPARPAPAFSIVPTDQEPGAASLHPGD